MEVNNKRICPLNQKECSDNCGLYDLIDKRCSIVTIASVCALIDTESVTVGLSDVREAVIEVSKSIRCSL